MSLCVVGSVALDTIETQQGTLKDALGGSAVYFSVAARFLSPVDLVGVVGDDFPSEHVELLRNRGIDLRGLQRKTGKTFRWWGRYAADMNIRETVEVHLNVFGEFQPEIPEAYKDSKYVFLANGSPTTQISLVDQVRKPKLVMADTMDLWIKSTPKELAALLERVDALILNDSEARQLTGEPNLVRAARKALALGPKIVIVKKGEHGAIMVSGDDLFMIPAFPCEVVRDPTGAGDSFAGALMSYVARADSTDPATLRSALAYATVLASFGVEDFGLRRLLSVTEKEIRDRLSVFRDMLSFKT